MKRLLGIMGILLFAACGRQQAMIGPLGQQAINLASIKCQEAQTFEWLTEIIARGEIDIAYKGSVYAIQYSSGFVFLHQPWVSSCFGCNLYSCDGTQPTVTEGEKIEIFAGALDENLIYTSTR
jgi:hypothetical protein